MEPALRARLGKFNPGALHFFAQVDSRDPEVMRTHDYHWFDKAWMVQEPPASPIRRGSAPLQHRQHAHRGSRDRLGRAHDAGRDARRAAALARARLHAGRAARRPCARRALHGRETMDDRAGGRLRVGEHASRLARPREQLVRGEQHLYLQQPGYGTSYLTESGDREVDRRPRRQLGDKFTMKRVHGRVRRRGPDPAR